MLALNLYSGNVMDVTFSPAQEARQPVLPAAALVTLAHGLALAALLYLHTATALPAGETVLQASWIAAPMRVAEEKPKPQITPPPTPKTKTPKTQSLLTAKPSAAPQETAPAAEPIATAPTNPAPSPASSHNAAPAAALPVSEPQFNADYLSNPAPDYPRLSRELKEQGIVQLRVHVSAEGRPTEILINRSSSYDRLDQAAINAVRQWRFVPAKRGSDALAAWVIVPINFTLRKAP